MVSYVHKKNDKPKPETQLLFHQVQQQGKPRRWGVVAAAAAALLIGSPTREIVTVSCAFGPQVASFFFWLKLLPPSFLPCLFFT